MKKDKERNPLLWKAPQAARLLGISVKTLYRWRAEGIIPHICVLRVGDNFYFKPELLKQWATTEAKKK